MLSIDKINQLEKENKQLKEDYKKAGETWEYLCQQKDKEIERLKSENETYDREQYYYYNLSEEYKQTLKEIKGVVTALYMNNWLQMNETARKSIQLLQDLITKAEEE